MDNCIFCKIANKQMSAQVVYEDEATTAVLDVNPIAPGHTMVLPKVHAETILDLPESQVAPVFASVRHVTHMLQDALHPDGFTIGINHGKWAGQAIDHLHIHIIPRWKTDGGKSIHSVVTNPPKEALTEIRKKIIKE